MSQHNLPIFFIVSIGRSGSTLLLNLLDANPNTLVPLESTFLIHLYTKYKHVKRWDKDTINEYLIDLYRMRKIRKRWKLNKEELRNKLYTHLNDDISYASLSKIIYLSYQSIYPKKEILIIGDKNPIYSFSIKEIKEIYPNAKFIHLIRDPRATVRSHMLSFNIKFLSFIAWEWLSFNREIETNKKYCPSSFLTVKYEDLVESPESKLKEICNFLNVNYNSNSLKFHEKVKSKYGDYKKYKTGVFSNLTKPVEKEISTKWESFFTEKQKTIINSICEKYLEKYNYEYNSNALTLFNRLEILIGRIYSKFWRKSITKFYTSPFWIKKTVFKIVQIIFE